MHKKHWTKFMGETKKKADYFKDHLQEDLRPESSFLLSWSECKNN